MSCTRLGDAPSQAPALHRLLCRECRHGNRADRMIGLAMDCLNAEPVPPDGPARVMRALSLPCASLAMQQVLRRRSADRLWRRALAVVMTLIVVSYTWLWWIDRDPGVRVPEPPMPLTNAFDDFEAAGLAVTMDDRIGEALSELPRDRKASATSLADLEKIIRQNEEALRLVRAGFQHEYREPPIRSFSQTLPHYAKDRGLARLLALEALVHERRGRMARANACDLDAIELGMRIRNGGTVIGALVGYACAAIGRAGLWDRLDRMSAQDARAALERLDRLERLRVPVADNLIEEKWCGVASLLEIMSDPRWRWHLGDLGSTGVDGGAMKLQNLAAYLAMLPFSKRAILDRYMYWLDRQVAYARAYPLMPEPKPEGSLDRINEVLLPVFSSLVHKDASERSMHSLLRASLALRAYRLERGGLPRSLDDLVRTGYIDAVPEDPFVADGSTLRYRLSPGGPVVYSVGPDHVDNGGAPIGQETTFRRELSRTVQADSIGDVVAGVNKP